MARLNLGYRDGSSWYRWPDAPYTHNSKRRTTLGSTARGDIESPFDVPGTIPR